MSDLGNDDEIVQAFLEESRENLDQLDLDLVDLEARPTDPDLLAQVFRTIHTIKGTCGFLGFRHLEGLAHAGENLLGALRAGSLTLDGPITTSLLALVDATRAVLRGVEATGAEGDDDHAGIVADLARHLTAGPDPEPGPAPEPPPAGGPGTADPTETAGAGSSVRVDVAVLDKLLDLVGELVLLRGQIGDLAADDDDGPLALPYRQLRLVTRELQDGVMQARLQPVGTVTGKFRRIARDLGAALDKPLRVELEGEDIGVDKAVNEALRDPLLHLVRNAVDHGLEPAAERAAAGKPAEGLLRIRAFHEGGHVRVEVSDDGRGIEADRLVERAVASGELTAEKAETLTGPQRLELIFRPGLSTKDEVTSVSGRGVGMDVVRTNLQKVGGSIEVSSEPGYGSVFLINVPLTLAIMPAVVVRCGSGRYAVPQVDIQEVVRLDADAVSASVDHIDGVRLHRLRGRLLPLIELASHLDVRPHRSDQSIDVVVVHNGGRRFGLVVDGVGETIEAVIRPLPRAVRAIPLFAGVTLLGDGEPALILDMAGLADAATITMRVGDEADEQVGPGAGGSRSSRLLLATGADGDHLAFPLAAVRRLEQFRASQVERTGGREVVQYGDAVLPMIRVATVTSDVLDAVVCTSSAGLVALVVDRIEDVVQEPAPSPTAAPSLVVGGRVTELVDIEALVAAAGLARTA